MIKSTTSDTGTALIKTTCSLPAEKMPEPLLKTPGNGIKLSAGIVRERLGAEI
jgi:hypothetical protein